MTDINDVPVEAWQDWLAIEHEAVWLYGLIGGRVDDLSDDARTAWDRHRDARDWLSGVIGRLTADPVGPLLSYPTTVQSAEDARRAAQAVEANAERAALACLGAEQQRPDIVAALRASARAAAEWGARPAAFPGLD